MFVLRFHSRFLKKWEWYSSRDPSVDVSIAAALKRLELDPLMPALRSHKVRDRNNRIVFSSRVTGDLRILWDYRDAEAHVIDLLDLGGHSGKRKVYR